MTNHTINLVDFADEFAARTNSLDVPFMHPAAATTIFHWLGFMRAAAENNRPVLVAEFARMIADKVELERRLNAEDEATATAAAAAIQAADVAAGLPDTPGANGRASDRETAFFAPQKLEKPGD